MMNWEDIQIQVEDPNPLVFSLGIVNFPEAEVDGFEFDFAWLPLEGWDLSGTVAYNDAQHLPIGVPGFPMGFIRGRGGRRPGCPSPPNGKPACPRNIPSRTWCMGAEPYMRFDYAHTGESINALERPGTHRVPGVRPADDGAEGPTTRETSARGWTLSQLERVLLHQ